MNKLFLFTILIFAGIVASTFVHAGYVVEVNTPTVITTMCMDDSGVNGNSATMRVLDGSGQELVPVSQMYSIDTGIFGYNVTFPAEGTYTTQETCNFSGTIVSSGDTYIVKKTSVDSVGKIDHFPSMSISGTDYQFGDTGKTFVTLSNSGVDVNNATCVVKIYYPNNTLFVPSTTMTFLDTGLYYYEFQIPNITGVYMVNAHCTYLTGNIQVNATSGTRVLGAGAGALSNTYLIDNVYWASTENLGDNRLIANNFTFNGINLSAGSVVSMDILFTGLRTQQGLDPASDPINIWLWNYNTSKFDLVGSPFSYQAADSAYTYTINGTNVSKYVNSSGGSVVYVNDSITTAGGDLANTELDIDLLNLKLNYRIPNSTATDISGGNELNVRNYVFDLSSQLSNTTVTVVQINTTVNNISNVTGLNAVALGQINSTVNQHTTTLGQINTTVNAIPLNVWNFTVRNLTYINGTYIATYVWNNTDRNLTYYAPATVSINVSDIANGVWNYTGTINSSILTQVGSTVWTTVGRYVNGILG